MLRASIWRIRVNRLQPPLLLAVIFCALAVSPIVAQDQSATVVAHWDKVAGVTKTTATLQVVVNPPLRRGSTIHDHAFESLRNIQADYVRYVPWLPYPKLAVAELEPPANGKTSWDFSLIDPMTIDFLDATQGHSVILNFSTIPAWMVKTDKPVPYPVDPDQPVWDYTQGTEFRDPSMKEVGDYYGRLFSWYTQGGFTDEFGKRHESGYHYSIPYWEVLNEIEFEHKMTPETYTKLYDSVVESIRRVAPQTKFVGLALAQPALHPEQFEYFLNPKNHKPGIPLDFISYHFYAVPTGDQTTALQPYTFFAYADGFLNVVRYIETIRKRLSPETKTTVDEIGAISADDVMQDQPGHVTQPIPNSYWNLTCAMYAYIFGELTRMGIDVAGESQLVGYPTQFPSVSMVDWNTGKPNSRIRLLNLLRGNFGPGDKIVETEPFNRLVDSYLYSLAVVKPDGKRRILVVNKRDRPFDITVPGAMGGQEDYVDQITGFDPPATAKLTSEKITLNGLAVAVVTLP
jgi:hypothetical protein